MKTARPDLTLSPIQHALEAPLGVLKLEGSFGERWGQGVPLRRRKPQHLQRRMELHNLYPQDKDAVPGHTSHGSLFVGEFP